MWPAQEYTRVVLEAPVSVAHQVSTLKDPHRVVLELEGVRLTPELAQLPTRVQASDPYIAAIRFGTRAPETLRVVFDLKSEARTQLFVLKPVAEFGYRVVLDLYPLTPRQAIVVDLVKRVQELIERSRRNREALRNSIERTKAVHRQVLDARFRRAVRYKV